MEVMKNVRSLAVRAAALLGILVALTLVVNLSWFDEDLHPDVAQLIPPKPVSMRDNAYPLVYGFTAARDRDPREVGIEIVTRLRERYEKGEPVAVSADEMAELLGTPISGDDWSGLLPGVACNARFELDCADRLIADLAQIDRVPSRLGLLLDRYEVIAQMPEFEENQEFDAYTPIPPYGTLMTVARIRLAMSFVSDSTEAFLDDVGTDIVFWKTMLRDGQSLIAKMVALAGLRNDTTYLSALMRRKPLSSEQLASIGRILTPLTDDERDIGETFLAELRIALLSSKDMGVVLDGPLRITELALQEQATINEYYLTTTVPMRLRASLSAAEFYRQRGYEQLSYEVRAVPPPVYNLGGKFVLKWMASEMSIQDYVSRVHDVDGRISLVLLQTEVAGLANNRIEDAVRASAYRNPYTLEPMDYDADAGTIGFDCLAGGADICAVAIR